MDAAHPVQFERVLDGLAESYRTPPLVQVHSGDPHVVEKTPVEGGAIHEKPAPEFGKGLLRLQIRPDGNPLRPEYVHSGGSLRIAFPVLGHEPFNAVVGDQQAADDQRVVFYVGGPDVEQPSDFIESRQQHAVATGAGDEIPEPCELGLPGLPRLDGEHRRVGNLGPVLPQQRQHVRYADHGPGQAAGEIHSGAEAVKGDYPLVAELHLQPFGNQNLPGHTRLVQFDPGAFELPPRLDEIPRVSPQSSMIQRDHDVAGLAGEAAQPLHLLPPFRRIFASVGVAARDQHGIPVPGPHESAQPFDSLPVDVFHTIQR